VLKNREIEILQKILTASFRSPLSVGGLVDEWVTRNRSLHSDERRELTGTLHDTIRWRRRIFGDIAPTRLDGPRLEASLAEARELRKSPPLTKWSALPSERLACALSYPTWLWESWSAQLGFESAVSLALAMNDSAPITFRANVLKTDRTSLIALLGAEGVAAREGKHSPWAIHLEGRRNVRALRAYKDGLLEAQDEGSQLAVLSAGAQSGQLVIDACARTGGKALALAALMGNRGRIVAADSDARPLEALERRSKRSGATILQTAWVAPDDPNPLPTFRGKADLVFVDAPCSGFGTLRRKPWMKWAVSQESVAGNPQKQITLLKRFAKWVKPGGSIAYTTCTIHAKENEEVIEAFLSEEKGFDVAVPARTVRPDREGCDGFFFVTLRNRSEASIL
jgi:16S rRNA (cytosine967-C5)-methyltransferase